MFKVLLLAQTNRDADTYPSMMLKIMKTIFGDAATVVTSDKPEWDKKNPIYHKQMVKKIQELNMSQFDFVIGVGDNHISKAGYDRDLWQGVPVIEFEQTNNRVHSSVDYMFYHIPTDSDHKNTFYVGSSVIDDHLYIEPRHSDKITIWVDHFSRRNDMTQLILDYLEKLYVDNPGKYRVLHQNKHGITQNVFKNDNDLNDVNYGKYDYDVICSLYRKADVLFPTHRETQGMLSAEIGMCGGLTIMRPYMYKEHILDKVPAIIYENLDDLDWKYIEYQLTEEKRKLRREKTMQHYSVDAMRTRIFENLRSIKDNADSEFTY